MDHIKFKLTRYFGRTNRSGFKLACARSWNAIRPVPGGRRDKDSDIIVVICFFFVYGHNSAAAVGLSVKKCVLRTRNLASCRCFYCSCARAAAAILSYSVVFVVGVVFTSSSVPCCCRARCVCVRFFAFVRLHFPVVFDRFVVGKIVRTRSNQYAYSWCSPTVNRKRICVLPCVSCRRRTARRPVVMENQDTIQFVFRLLEVARKRLVIRPVIGTYVRARDGTCPGHRPYRNASVPRTENDAFRTDSDTPVWYIKQTLCSSLFLFPLSYVHHRSVLFCGAYDVTCGLPIYH